MITDKYENQFSRSDKAASLLPLFSSGSCPGTNIQFRKCPLRPCSSKDSAVSRPIRGLRYGMAGIWSEWTEWSSCSKSCGTGLKTRKRKCMEGACRAGIQINILLSNILQQYIDIANINIGFSKIAISISILENCWQYIANILIEQYIANFEQYIADFLVDEKIF